MPNQPVVGSGAVNLTLVDDAYRRAAARVTATQAQLNNAMYGASTAARTYGQSTNVLTNSVNRLTTSLTSSIIATAGYALGVNALRHAIGGSIREFRDWERGLVAIGKTADLTDSQLESLGRRFDALLTQTSSVGEGQAIATTADDLLEIGEIAGQLGVTGVGAIANFTETVALMRLTTTLSAEEASNALGRLVANTTATINDVTELGSAITELGNRFLGGEQAITGMAERIARATSEFRLEPQFLLGISAALSAAGNEAEQSSTVIQRGLRALQNAANQYIGGSNPTTLTSIANAAGIAVEELYNQIANSDWQSAFLNLIRAFEQTRGLGGDAEFTDSDLFRSLFGGVQAPVRVAQTFGVLERQLPQVELGISLAEGELERPTALIEEAQRALDTYASRMIIAQNDIEHAMRNFGETIIPLQVAVYENWRLIAGAITVAAGVLTQFFAIRGFQAFQQRQEQYNKLLRDQVIQKEKSAQNDQDILRRERDSQRESVRNQARAQSDLDHATRNRIHNQNRATRLQAQVDAERERNIRRAQRLGRGPVRDIGPELQGRHARAQQDLNKAIQQEASARSRVNRANTVYERRARRVADATQEASNSATNLANANRDLLVASRPLLRVQRFLRNAYLALGGAVGLTIIAVQVAVAAFTFWRRRVTETADETEELTSRIASLNSQFEQLASGARGATSDVQFLESMETAIVDIDAALVSARERIEELQSELVDPSLTNFLNSAIFETAGVVGGESSFGTWIQELTSVHSIQQDIANQEELINRLTQDRSSLIEREANAREIIAQRSEAAAGDPEQRFRIPIERSLDSDRRLEDFASSQIRRVQETISAVALSADQLGADFVQSLTLQQVDELTSSAIGFIEERERELARLEEDIANAETRRAELVRLQQETTQLGSERYKQFENEINSLTERIDENTASAEEQARALEQSGTLLTDIPGFELQLTEANERAFYNELERIENEVSLDVPVDLQLVESVEQFIVSLRRRLQDATDNIDFGESLLPTYSLRNQGEGEIQRQAATEARNTATAIEQQRQSLEDRRTEIENTISALERQLAIDREYQSSLGEFAPEQFQVAERIRSTTQSLELNREQLGVVSTAFDVLSERSAAATQDLGNFESNARRLLLLDINRQIAQIENEFVLPGLTPEDAQRQAQQFAREFRREMTNSLLDVRFAESLVPTFALANQGEGESLREAATATRDYVDQVQAQRRALYDARREIERSIETQEDLIDVYRDELAVLDDTDPRRVQYTRAIRDAETALAQTNQELQDNISAFDSLSDSAQEAADSYDAFLNIARRSQIAEIESQIAQIENAFRLPGLEPDDARNQARLFAQEMQRELQQAFSDIEFTESLVPLASLANQGEAAYLSDAANTHRQYAAQAEERLHTHQELVVELERTARSQERLIDLYRDELEELDANDTARIEYVRAIADTETALERTESEIRDNARALSLLEDVLEDATDAYEDFEEIARRAQIARIAEEVARIQNRRPVSENAPTAQADAERRASEASARALGQRLADVQRERAELLSISESRLGPQVPFTNRGDLEIERQAIRELHEYERALLNRNAALHENRRALEAQIDAHERSIARWEEEIENLDEADDHEIVLTESIQGARESIVGLTADLEDNSNAFGPVLNEIDRLVDRFAGLRAATEEEYVLALDFRIDEIQNQFRLPEVEDLSFVRRVEDFYLAQRRALDDRRGQTEFASSLTQYAFLPNRGDFEAFTSADTEYNNLLGQALNEERRLNDEREEITRSINDLERQQARYNQSLSQLTRTDPDRVDLHQALEDTKVALDRERESLVRNEEAYGQFQEVIANLLKVYGELVDLNTQDVLSSIEQNLGEIHTSFVLPYLDPTEAIRSIEDFREALGVQLDDLLDDVDFEESLLPFSNLVNQGERSVLESTARAQREFVAQITERRRAQEQTILNTEREIADAEKLAALYQARADHLAREDPTNRRREDYERGVVTLGNEIGVLTAKLGDERAAYALFNETVDESTDAINQNREAQERLILTANVAAGNTILSQDQSQQRIPRLNPNTLQRAAVQFARDINREFTDAAADIDFGDSQVYLTGQFGGGFIRSAREELRRLSRSVTESNRSLRDQRSEIELQNESLQQYIIRLKIAQSVFDQNDPATNDTLNNIVRAEGQIRDNEIQLVDVSNALQRNLQTSQMIADQEENVVQRVRAATEQQIFAALQLRSAFEYIADGVQRLEDAFVRLISTGEFSFRDFVNAVVADIARIAVRLSITLPLLNIFSTFFGAGIASTGGGFSGAALGGGSLPPQLQNLLPTLHSGGIIDGSMGREQLVVLERGEEVLTRNDPRHRYNSGQSSFLSRLTRYHDGGVVGGGSGTPNVSLELINRSNSQLQIEDAGQRVEGGRLVQQVVLSDLRRNGPIAQNVRLLTTGRRSG